VINNAKGSTGQNNQQVFSSAPNSFELSFNDHNNNPLGVNNSSHPIFFQLARSIDNSNGRYQFNKVNASKMNFSSGQQLMINSFTISTVNSSVHIQLNSINLSLAYLIVLKFGGTLNLNSSDKTFDYFQIMCPNSSK
jgi:hypothetical protein